MRRVYCPISGTLLAIHIPKKYIDGSTSAVDFVTEGNHDLQIAIMQRDLGQDVEAHYHKKQKRVLEKTTEVLYLITGNADVTVWTLDHDNPSDLQVVPLAPGDLIYIIEGCHSIKFTSKAKFFEIKQGPFSELSDKVKL